MSDEMQSWMECLRFAVAALKADRIKAFLTTLSVLIGSASENRNPTRKMSSTMPKKIPA